MLALVSVDSTEENATSKRIADLTLLVTMHHLDQLGFTLNIYVQVWRLKGMTQWLKARNIFFRGP